MDGTDPDDEQLIEEEDAAYDAQDEWIQENCGKEAAASANYGWFVDYIKGTIGTKVYGHGVLVTQIRTLEHEWNAHE